MPPLDRLSTVNEPRDASSYSCWNCTCGRIGSCILVGTAHVARQASAYSLWNCTCGKIGSCKVELHMWEKCDSWVKSYIFLSESSESSKHHKHQLYTVSEGKVVFFNLALTEGNIQIRFDFKLSVY